MKRLCFIVGLCFMTLLSSGIFAQEQAQFPGNNNDRPMNTPETVRRSINDAIAQFGSDYPNGEAWLKELDQLEQERAGLAEADVPAWTAKFSAFARKALLANPLLDFDRILVLQASRLPTPNDNFLTLDKAPKSGWDCEFQILSDLRAEDPKLDLVFKPEEGRPIAEPDLHWDARHVIFSSIAPENGRWGVFELDLDTGTTTLLTPTTEPDVDFFDACYAPDGAIITCSNAGKQGLPCINGSDPMADIYRVERDTKKVRQLTFEQDSDWHVTPLSNGRIMYLRWEYSDIMHYYSRILFHMNPDGTNQAELYGSGSLFPTAFKYAREIPDSSQIVGVGSGHHGRGDVGRLLIIDPTIARKYPFRFHPTDKVWGKEGTQYDCHPEIFPMEKTGCVQEIPGYGQDVVGNVLDMQSTGLKYNFAFPWPLSETYFLVSCQIAGDESTYGLYLVDIFDNMTLIKKIPNKGLFYPLALEERPVPPVLPDRYQEGDPNATVFITDVYNGVGTQTVPRGTIKGLKVFGYHFAYLNSGGHESVGVQSSWDIKRLLGYVPVEEDGSAFFKIPANTPVSIQPVDKDGAAVQLFRSWFVGMPGENVSCNGCHESQLDATPSVLTTAARRAPDELVDYLGPKRSITFELDLYHRVVKKYCIGCHDGSKDDRPSFATAKSAYDNIHPFVRRPGPETDLEVLPACEYHISTSELWQMLEKGHYNVKLDDESKRLIANWVDFNAPWRGHWDNATESKRRLELSEMYANVNVNIEDEYTRLLDAMRAAPDPEFVQPEEYVKPTDELASDWTFDENTARELQKQAADGGAVSKQIDLGNGVTMDFVLIPAGTFVMGSLDGYPDESPRKVVRIEKPFWMSTTEVTNEQYNVYDPEHDTRYIEEHGKDHIVPGYIANHPKQPVSRVSWKEANEFVNWLRGKGLAAAMPTEAEWEWAARCGSGDKFYFGTFDVDFSKYANLADAGRRTLYNIWEAGATIHIRRPYPENSVFPLRDDRFTDNWFTVDFVAQCTPNAWGLFDMIGNVSEWTRSLYKPYPYQENALADANTFAEDDRTVARGGSWADRPKVTGSATRYAYLPWQKVHNVGIRVILETP
ncbi:MAG: SUMF1/EgtB/PvdO family nonheme iron enzyme [Planctomycetia bacterium]|nr:SUMF1/EgtB/PvdO family nonheme iron enzyme [Planctomycetia bacterium]